MKARFSLDSGTWVECHWSPFSGLERYIVDGAEVHRVRSLRATGDRRFRVEFGGCTRTILIKLLFRPGLRTLLRSSGFVAEVYLDGELLIPDLLDRKYRVRSPLTRVAVAVTFLAAAGAMLLALDVQWLEGRFTGLSVRQVPQSVEILNAALAEPECRAALAGQDSQLLLPADQARALRNREQQRDRDWILEGGRTALSVITAVYEDQSSACRGSILALLDSYLGNGADIDQRFGGRRLTVMELAVVSGDVDLACALLVRGASLEEKVQVRQAGGAPSEMTGMSLIELAEYRAQRNPAAEARRMVELLRNYAAQGQCGGNRISEEG